MASQATLDDERSPFDILAAAGGQDPTPGEAPPADEGESDLVGQLQQAFLLCDRERAPFANEWNVYNDALFAGDRGTELRLNNYNGDYINVVNLNRRDLTVKNNQMITVYGAWKGKMTRNQPRRTVAPGNGSIDEMLGCRAADRLIEIGSNLTKLNRKLDDAKSDIPWGSNGYLELGWDPQGGGITGRCETCAYEDDKLINGEECPHCAIQAQSYLEMQQMAAQGAAMGMPQEPLPPPPPPPPPMVASYKGGPRVDHIDPRNIWLQPGVDRWENLEYYFVRIPYSVTKLREMFPEAVDKIHSEPVYPASGALYSIDARTGTMSPTRLQNQAFLFKYSERPSTLFPRGRIIFMANSRILRVTDNPYFRFQRFPLFHFGWHRIPGTLYTLPPIANAYQLQEQLNQVETKIYEHMVLTNAPKVINPQQSGISDDEITASTGQQLRPKRQFAQLIQYLTPPPLAPENFARPGMLKEDLRAVMGVTQQELAVTPTDANGRYAAMAQAASDQSVGPILRQHYDEEADLVRCMLILYQDNMPKEDSFSMFNENFLEEYSFADLNFNPYNLQVIIDADDGLASNQAVRWDQISTAVQLGLFGMPGTPSFNAPLFVKAARWKVPGMIPDKQDIAVQNANAIIKQIESGEPWQPQPEDDVPKFMEVLTQWLQVNGRRNPAQLKNPMAVDQVRQALMVYGQIFAQAQAAMQAQQPPEREGEPSQPGGPSAPGGTPESSGGASGTDTNDSGLNQQAQQGVQQADAAADAQTRPGQPHES